MEHSTLPVDTVAQLCSCAVDLGLTPWVRVPERDYLTINRVLDGGAARLIPGVFPVRAHPPREPERRPVLLYRLWFLSARGYQRGVHDSAPRHQETARRADQGESRETGVFQKEFEQVGTARCACGARVRRGRRRKMTVARCASKQEVDSCEARSAGLQAGAKSRLVWS